MPRFQCPECKHTVTLGPSGIEYGHARGRRAGADRCSQRPDCVDPTGPGGAPPRGGSA